MPAIGAYDLKLRSFITSFRAESAALWFLCFYIFIEYIRPQSMYPVFDFLPWGQLAILACVASVFMTKNKSQKFIFMDFLFVTFCIVVVLSIIFAWRADESLKMWATFTSWALLYFCVISILNTPNKIFLFVLFFIIINLKMSEFGARSFILRGFSFTHWGVSGPPGWFRNSGELALQMGVMFSISLSVLLAFREYVVNKKRWWFLLILFPGTALLAVIASSSRGGQLALAAVLLVFILKGPHLIRKLMIISALIFIVMQIFPDEQVERFSTMGEDGTSESRLVYWEVARDIIDKNPLGIGYNNWSGYYASIYQPDRNVEEIHNSVYQAFVELGYHGGILFLIMVVVALIMNARTVKDSQVIGGVDGLAIGAIARGVNLGLLATIIAGAFMSVLYYPMFWLAFALTSALRQTARARLLEVNRSIVANT